MTNRQIRFVDEYVQCWNSAEAARRAGYHGDANTVGPRLLADVGIKAIVETKLRESAMSADEVLHRLGEQARGEGAKYICITGTGKTRVVAVDVERIITDGKQHLIKSVTRNARGDTIVEFYDAQAALALLGRHFALFMDKNATGEDVYREHMNSLRRALAGEGE